MVDATGPDTLGFGRPDLVVDIRATPQSVRDALLVIDGQLADWGLSGVRQTDIRIVLAEALNNVVEHAYPRLSDGRITLALWRAAHHVDCEIRDTGAPMTEKALPQGRLPSLAARAVRDLPEGGFGWVLIRQLTTGLRYRRIGGENRLSLRLRLD